MAVTHPPDSGARILLIDDERAIRRLLRAALAAHGYEVLEAATGEEGLQSAATQHPDVIILDLGLPDLDGVQVTRRLREWTQTPILILSVRGSEEDKIAALDAGADDYLTKPFSTNELLARIRAQLRRVARSQEESRTRTLEYGDLTIDLDSARVTVKGEEVQLRAKEYGLLTALASRPGALATRQWLSREIWGEEFMATSRTIDVHIRRLRSVLEKSSDFDYIHTLHGMGYRFDPIAREDA